MYMNSSGIGVRPPSLSRVSSDSVAVQMSHTSLNSGSSSYCGSPIAGAPCSPLTRVQHSTPSLSHGLNSSVQYNVAAFSSVPLSLSNIQTSSFTQCYSQWNLLYIIIFSYHQHHSNQSGYIFFFFVNTYNFMIFF